MIFCLVFFYFVYIRSLYLLNIFQIMMDDRLSETCIPSNLGVYSKKPQCVTTFNLFTFFRADLIQSEVNWELSSASHLIMAAQKNVN